MNSKVVTYRNLRRKRLVTTLSYVLSHAKPPAKLEKTK